MGIVILLLLTTSISSYSQYIMPEETSEHEGTWLQWPHQYTYGMFYRNSLDNTWVEMTSALQNSEKVHIIAYNLSQKNRIITLLNNANVPLTNVDFYIYENDDVWVRDNGPMFVYDNNDDLTIIDWGFNGWGGDAPFLKCDLIPAEIGSDISIPVMDLSAMVLEGGAIEIDGKGTMMATRSSVTHSSRNPELTETQIEDFLSDYVGISNFIWLDGVYGSEITDMHIDGFMKFANDSTIVTFNTSDLQYWELSQDDINTLYNSVNNDGKLYNFIYVPLTQNDVITEYGNELGYKGSYCNYYIANTVVLVPNYNDPNDVIANAIIQDIYPNRTVIGIDVRNLYENGGMIHCVTQQQPVLKNSTSINSNEKGEINIGEIFPNPTNSNPKINFKLKENSLVRLDVFNMNGKQVISIDEKNYMAGDNIIVINVKNLNTGIYTYIVSINNIEVQSAKMIIK